MSKNTGDGELEEILFMAFVGLWMRDADGNFVSLDDKYGVLKDRLKVEIKKYAAQEVIKARLDELESLKPSLIGAAREYHEHDTVSINYEKGYATAQKYLQNRIQELTKEKESSDE